MDSRLRRLADLAASQNGAASFAQAEGLGIRPQTLRAWARRGDVIRLGRRCVTFPGTPEGWYQQLRVGLLDLGPEAAVAGRAAAALLGLDGFARGDLEFIVPRHLRERSTVGRVRSIADLAPIDTIEVEGFRCCSGALLVVELARRAARDELVRATDSVIRDGWSSETFLRRRLVHLRHPGRDGVRLLDDVLGGPRAESWLERRFLQLVRAARLPEPRTQVIHRRSNAQIARLDALWEPDLVVEINGHRGHSTRRQLQADEQRRTELTAVGYRVVVFTYDDVVMRPQWVITKLRELLPEPARLSA
jgi:very-short-patch-repair endonuclease